MMALVHHQPPVHGGQLGIDLARRVGRDIESAFDAIAAALRDALSRPVDAARGILGRKQPAEAADVALIAKARARCQHTDEQWREGRADPRNRAQRIRGVQALIKHLNPPLEISDVAIKEAHQLDFLPDLNLQCVEIDLLFMEGDGIARRLFQRFDQLLHKRSAVGMVSSGVPGDESRENVAPGLENALRIEELAQQRQRQARHGIRERRFQRWAGPADKIEHAPARGADGVLVTMPLLGKPLQRMMVGRRDVNRIETRSTEIRDRAQNMGVDVVRLGMLAQVLAQCLDPLPIDPDHLDAGALQLRGDRKPRPFRRAPSRLQWAYRGARHPRLWQRKFVDP